MKIKPYVNQSGSGPALVLLHGWGLHGGIWETILPALEENFTVYNVDLPGFGYSAVSNDDYTLDYLVESVASVLPTDEPFYLMGWSLGGLVATALALAHPDRINKLITVASNPCFVAADDWSHGMEARIMKSFIAFLEEDYKGTLIRFLSIQTMGSATQKDDIKRLKETVFIHGQPSKKALTGGLEILQDINLVPRLRELKLPVLRLYGRLDSLVPAKVIEDIEKYLPHSQAIVYHSAAHAPFLSSGDLFLKDVKQFLLADELSGTSQVGDIEK